MLIVPKLRCQVVGCAHSLDLFIVLASLGCLMLSQKVFNLFANTLKSLAFCGRCLICYVRFFLNNLLNVSEVTQLGGVVLREKHVQRLYVPMDDVARMNVVDAKTHVYEYFPEKVVRE